MSVRPAIVVSSLLTLALVGCLADQADRFNDNTRMFEEDIGALTVSFAPGALSTIHNEGEAGALGLPHGSLVLMDGRWIPAEEEGLDTGETLEFLLPPGISTFTFTFQGVTHELDATGDHDHKRLLDGDQVVEWLHYQQENFPDHNPGTQAYIDAGRWAADRMEEWGYEVVVDEYGSLGLPQEVCPPVPASGQQACPASFANVVGTKPGSDPEAGIVIVGGHYDIVPQVTHGAYDNTAGAMTTLALAKALAPYTFDQTVIFGLWGGEESGTLGSSSWIASHPEVRAEANVYWNLDVIGNSWPSPLPDPTNVHIPYGPDSGDESSPDPLGDALEAWAKGLVDASAYPAEKFDYVGAVESALTSDHVPFMAEGIPAYSPNSHPEAARVTRIHTEQDTVLNMSAYALWGVDFTPDERDPPQGEELQEAEAILARSFEPYMWLVFDHIVLSDQGLFDPYGAGASAT